MKKKISLETLSLLQPYIDNTEGIFIAKNDELITFVDSDPLSSFFFQIVKENILEQRQYYWIIKHSPKSDNDIGVHSSHVHKEHLKEAIEGWIERLRKYSKLRFVEDIEDPIVEAFAEEYYDSFEIVDDDADVKPYSIKQIGYIETLLLGLGQEIEQNREEYVNQSSLEVVAEIEYRIEDIMATIYQSTKKTIAKKISRLFGFITKEGGPLLREAIKNAITEVIKIGVKEVFKIE